MPTSYIELVALAATKRDLGVKRALENDLKIVSFELGRIEVALVEGTNPMIIATLAARLKNWTGRTWLVTMSTKEILEPTIGEVKKAKELEEYDIAHDDELVTAILQTFDGSKLVNVKIREQE
jgi:DNA polymerase-3 subunit gamma/tau